MTDQTTTTRIDASPLQHVITLDEPITRGDTTIKTITLRRPAAGELRGLSLQQLATMDADAVMRLLPRITTPSLVDHEVRALAPADLTQFALEVAGFLATKASKAEYRSLTA